MLLLMLACTAVKEPDGDPDFSLGSLQGDYAFTMGVAPVNGLAVTFQATFASTITDGIESFTAELKPVSADGVPGEVCGSMQETVLNADGTFSATVEELLWPAAYTPTGGDITVSGTLAGRLLEDGRMCGDVEGEIVTFEMDLVGSTFGVELWDQQSAEPLQAVPRCSHRGVDTDHNLPRPSDWPQHGLSIGWDAASV